jgi:hypothetical protein
MQKTKHFIYEVEAWQRALDFMMEENIILKNRLSETLNFCKKDNQLVDIAEYFLNRFIKEDDMIRTLRYDIRKQNVLLSDLNIGNGIFMKIQSQQRSLRTAMEFLKKEFSLQESEFNNYFDENL